MTSKHRFLVLLACLPLLPLFALAENDAQPPAAAEAAAQPADGAQASAQAGSGDAPEQAAGAGPEPAQHAQAPAFDPATVGLAGLPQPMTGPEDFRKALALIDERVAALKARQGRQSEAAPGGSAASAGAAGGEADLSEAAAADIARRIEVLGALRVAVQRRATLAQRLDEVAAELSLARTELKSVEQDGLTRQPPYLVSLLDQDRAELALKQAVEDVAETRVDTATRRRDAAAKVLSAALSERRAARDGQSEADAGVEPDTREQVLALARLKELLARQQLAAAESALALARDQDSLAEVQQRLVAARIRYLEPRVVLPCDALEQRVAELKSTGEELQAQIEELSRTGDQAEAALYRARRRLADAGADADRAALQAWVDARQTELGVARAGVDSLSAAAANLAQMQRLWELRYRFMNEPEAVDLAQLQQQVIADAAAARAAKSDIERRLSALRSIQLAQGRRLDDPGLGDSVRKALAARSAALDRAEGYGRQLLETGDALIALLEGMRQQLEARVQQQDLSLKLLHARQALAQWWDTELIVIDDQSIRVRDLVTALAMFLVVLAVVSLIRRGARRALRRRKAKSPGAEYGDLRLVVSAVAGNTSQLFVLIAAFYVAMTFSGLASPTVGHWLWTALVVAFYAQLGIWATAAMVDYFNRRRSRQEMRDPSTVTGYGLMMFFVRVGIWITVGVSLLAYFKYPIAGLLGALGVGSVAAALALQNILGDVFSSMAIILDKPFRVGDFIMSGQTLGVIENIGVKTTRIRSLSGEQVVLSNSDLLNSRIHNFKHFKERRIAFRIGVVYQTPRALLERIPDMLRRAVEEQPGTRFDRAHFAELGDFALTFEIVYYVLSPDYTRYMDVQQGINLGIHRRFEEAGVSFAYPTQELILRRGAEAVQ